MVGDQRGDEIVMSEQGVEITKRLETEEYELPSIEFVIESRRSDTAVIHLVDRIPDEVEVTDLGFHPEYGKDHWQVENDAVIFERELARGESYHTLYGVGDEDAELESFMAEPADLEVDRRTEDDGQRASLREDIPDVENAEEVSDVGASAAVNLSLQGDGGEDDSQNEDGAQDGRQQRDTGDNMKQHPESVVEALVAEIDEYEAGDDTLETLREALSLRNGSMAARMTRLQSEVDELRAYTAALEEFLDENGTGMDLIEDLQDNLDTVESDVNELRSTVSDHDDHFTTIDESIEELDTTAEEAHEQRAEITDQITQLEAQVTDIEGRVPEDGVTEEMDELRQEVQKLRDWQDQLTQAFGSPGDDEHESEDE